MPLRTRLTKHTSPMATEGLQSSECQRSRISNQDVNLLKKLGFTKQVKTLIFPDEESYPTPRIGYRVTFVDHLIRGLATPIHEFLRGLLFVYGLQLHHLTPNSILHISIFITLCECFLGTPPNWGPWKRIFLVRRNSSHTTAYNVGGVVICVRPDVEYFDVKFPDSVQGWRKRWLYVQEAHNDVHEYNVAPFDGGEKIVRRCSWDAEASDEEKTATDALMKRIHELQNTRGKELSGIQITAYFLRIRVQPLQARKNPLWMYAGAKDVDRFSKDLSIKDLERLVRKISSLSNGDEEEDPIVNVTAHTSTSHTLVLSETRPATEETSPPQRDIGNLTPPGNPRAPSPKKARVEPVEGSNLLPGSSSTSALDDPLMQQFIHLGTQFVGYRDHANSLKEALTKANKRADDLSLKLAKSEKAREKAELESASVESLRKRLHDAENALSEHTSQQLAREADIAARLESQNRRFVRETSQEYQLEKPEHDCLLDALSLLEIYGDEVRQSISDAKAAFSRLFPYFFPKIDEPNTFAALAKHFIPKEDLGLALRQENLKIGVEGTIALVAESQQSVDWAKVGDVKNMETKKWQSMIKAAKPSSKKILSFLGYKPTPSPSASKPEVK
ncbi:hypothetical protein QYE76_029436 [Lolium multiflorum]|uniref:Transposase (putative) gypsy type domain-containing protein n=1 Tax=Lolium multiflorum TaxID=4521 RepID=A0AAD8VI93_LOLMU|nr:hypothetical protein QYE76_029436 [Lolium multiflorum]